MSDLDDMKRELLGDFPTLVATFDGLSFTERSLRLSGYMRQHPYHFDIVAQWYAHECLVELAGQMDEPTSSRFVDALRSLDVESLPEPLPPSVAWALDRLPSRKGA
jgi:hypothetical protein